MRPQLSATPLGSSPRGSITRVALLFALTLLPTSCGTLENGRGWGQDATLLPDLWTVGDAAIDAAIDPWTWVPVLGALAMGIDDWDHDISEWARKDTPVFGSNASAKDASDALRTILLAASVASTFAADSGPQGDVWLYSKAKGLGVSAIGVVTSDKIVSDLKTVTARGRPNGGERSMPSTHAAQSFATAAWTVRTLEHVSISEDVRAPLQVTARTLAVATAWARVEGEMHYPSDVLIGAAIGNFLSSFAHDAFLGLPGDPVLSTSIHPSGEGVMVGISWTF